MDMNTLVEERINKVLDLLIAEDETTKKLTFLTMVSSYGNDSLNIALSGPTSSGKSFVPLQISELFPTEDIIKVAYASPSAFFHDYGTVRENGTISIDFRRKILLFLDSPHHALIERLRPVLSGDDPIINIKICDRNERMGLRTKNIQIIGRPATVYCSANLLFDAQELSRFIFVSPGVDPSKIEKALDMTLRRSANYKSYQDSIVNNSDFLWLKKRIEEIKNLNVSNIILPDNDLSKKFLDLNRIGKPRVLRDAKRICSIAKAIALINFEQRKIEGETIWGAESDIKQALELWNRICEEQYLGVSPYLLNIYKEIIIPFVGERKVKKTALINEIAQNPKVGLQEWEIRQRILPALTNAGLLLEEKEGKLIWISIPENCVRNDVGCTPDSASHIKKDCVRSAVGYIPHTTSHIIINNNINGLENSAKIQDCVRTGVGCLPHTTSHTIILQQQEAIGQRVGDQGQDNGGSGQAGLNDQQQKKADSGQQHQDVDSRQQQVDQRQGTPGQVLAEAEEKDIMSKDKDIMSKDIMSADHQQKDSMGADDVDQSLGRTEAQEHEQGSRGQQQQKAGSGSGQDGIDVDSGQEDSRFEQLYEMFLSLANKYYEEGQLEFIKQKHPGLWKKMASEEEQYSTAWQNRDFRRFKKHLGIYYQLYCRSYELYLSYLNKVETQRVEQQLQTLSAGG